MVSDVIRRIMATATRGFRLVALFIASVAVADGLLVAWLFHGVAVIALCVGALIALTTALVWELLRH